MRGDLVKGTCSVIVLCVLTCRAVLAQNESPVRIEFDENSKRIDIMTGKKLQAYQYVKRGSIQFFRDRLDTPDDFITFSHDGIIKAQIKDMKSMEKIQKQFTVWTLKKKSGWKDPSPVHSRAVSFIPLSLSTKEPQDRVYLLLDDLKLINWDND